MRGSSVNDSSALTLENDFSSWRFISRCGNFALWISRHLPLWIIGTMAQSVLLMSLLLQTDQLKVPLDCSKAGILFSWLVHRWIYVCGMSWNLVSWIAVFSRSVNNFVIIIFESQTPPFNCWHLGHWVSKDGEESLVMSNNGKGALYRNRWKCSYPKTTSRLSLSDWVYFFSALVNLLLAYPIKHGSGLLALHCTRIALSPTGFGSTINLVRKLGSKQTIVVVEQSSFLTVSE